MSRAARPLLVLLVLLAAVLALAAAAPARAAGYRYWSFWERADGAWTYATTGPGQNRPSDGDVEGFRFAVSADSEDATKPRGAADFGTICSGTHPRDGKKRVAVVVDFGTAADAPSGETPPKPRTACARVGTDATAAEALAAVAEPLRYDSSALLCAISGYPRTGCGEQVSGRGQGQGQKQDQGHRTGGGGGSSLPSVGVLAGVVAVVALGGAAIWQAKRRRD
ncbi:SCO2322 family protein [Streptomyces sp. NPDC088785]|uniref:SCO2322 family protein n=1 Tax=Streptomyces sp. NPDC088785 TaxID=3365897 RepID=UPI00382CF2B2